MKRIVNALERRPDPEVVEGFRELLKIYSPSCVVADTYLGDIIGAKDKLRDLTKEVSGVQVIDDYTLEITIDAPKAYFLAKLTYPTAFVVDRENVEGPQQAQHAGAEFQAKVA